MDLGNRIQAWRNTLRLGFYIEDYCQFGVILFTSGFKTVSVQGSETAERKYNQ